jgi:hypothetical protein
MLKAPSNQAFRHFGERAAAILLPQLKLTSAEKRSKNGKRQSIHP